MKKADFFDSISNDFLNKTLKTNPSNIGAWCVIISFIVSGDGCEFTEFNGFTHIGIAKIILEGNSKFDFDGDGKADLSIFRPDNGAWYLQQSNAGFASVGFGISTDKITPADYDGDGRTDVAVFRPSNGVWYLLQSTNGFTGITFGLGTDIPVAADYDGDGKADLAVVRNGIWYLNRSTQGFTGIQFGISTDLPIPNAFVR